MRYTERDLRSFRRLRLPNLGLSMRSCSPAPTAVRGAGSFPPAMDREWPTLAAHTTTDKEKAYAELVQARRECRVCAPELVNPSEVQGGALDSAHVGPYSRWQGNLDASVAIVAQDFADEASFASLGGWPGERVGTNLMLTELLAEAGIATRPPKRGEPADDVFFTNAVLCLKRGSMSTQISKRCFRECGARFLRPTMELIKPKVIVTLGLGALDASLPAFGLRRPPGGLADLVNRDQIFRVSASTVLIPRFHPSRTVRNVTRTEAQQREDWRRIRPWLG